MSRNNPKYIVVHHSWTKDGKVKDFKAIQRYHKGKGWRDIGYHYIIEDVEGKVTSLQGRKELENGAHAIGFNTKSIGICVVGNFDLTEMPLSKFLLLIKLIRYLRAAHNIPVKNVIGHWETYKLRNVTIEKSCPGKKVDMSELRSYV